MPVHPGSRYAQTPRRTLDDGPRAVPYLDLRLVRTPRALRTYVVQAGDRTDLVAHRLYGDPERFWRLCDAQRVLWPEDLVAQPGRRLAVPDAEG